MRKGIERGENIEGEKGEAVLAGYRRRGREKLVGSSWCLEMETDWINAGAR